MAELIHTAKKVNKVFAIGSQSFAKGASSRSYNESVGSRIIMPFVHQFIIAHKPLVLCRDSFFASVLQRVQMSASGANGNVLQGTF